MNLYHEERGIQIYHGDSIAEGLPCECDALITDPPYSERTHAGHRDGVASVEHGSYVVDGVARGGGGNRRVIGYETWTIDDVCRVAVTWSPMVRGWMVVVTDHILAPVWSEHLAAAGRYVFAPLPWFSPGSRVRLAGDGPSSWTCWIVVSRPRHPPYSKWGTLPGGYVTSPEKQALVGGKPRRLMLSLVADYSRVGDVVCDPCCGAGTTLLAARDLGRTAIGIDISEEHCQMAAGRRAFDETAAQRTLFSR